MKKIFQLAGAHVSKVPSQPTGLHWTQLYNRTRCVLRKIYSLHNDDNLDMPWAVMKQYDLFTL